MENLLFVITSLIFLYAPLMFVKYNQRKFRKKKFPDVEAEIEFSDEVYINGDLIKDYYKKIKLITIFEDRISVSRGSKVKKFVNYSTIDPLIKNNFENATWEEFIDFLLEKNPKTKVDYYKPLWKRMLFIK